jgi:transposase
MLYVGIDVAKDKHDCCIISDNHQVLSAFTFANSRDGYDKFMSEIKRFSKKKDFSDTKTGLESTGHYSTNITNFLLQKRLSVKIYNPLQVSMLRKAATLRKTKTDKSDAKFLAELLTNEDSKPRLPTVSSVSELKIHTRNRFRLIKQRSKLKLSISRLITVLFPELPSIVYSINQKSSYALLLEYPTADAISKAHITKLTNLLCENSKGKYGREKAEQIRNSAKNSIGLNSNAMGFELRQTIRLIQNLEEEIALLNAEIKRIMDEINSPVMSVPGIGYTLGAIIISEIGNIENFDNPNQLLKFAGLEPTVYESGKFKAENVSMVKRGSPYLRWAMLQAARLSACHCTVFHEYMEKKLSEGKHFYVAQSHVAKKLIRVLFSLMKNDKIFEQAA